MGRGKKGFGDYWVGAKMGSGKGFGSAVSGMKNLAMKQILLLLAFVLLIGGRVFSQERPYGIVLRLVNENTRTADQFSWMVGMDAGLELNQRYQLGFYASMAPFGYYPAGYDDRDEFTNYLEQAGIFLRLKSASLENIRPYLQIKSGYGNLSIGEDNASYFTDHSFYVFQPSVGLEYELDAHWRIAADLHYRHSGPLDLYVYKYGSISGAGITLSLEYVIW
jgi:hypothetical protein